MTLRIALANIAPGRTREEALSLAVESIHAAGDAGADVVCFPECYVPGYRVASRPAPPPDEHFLKDAWATAARAAASAGTAVILGTERIVDGAPRISALVIGPDGRAAGFQDKVQLDPSEESTFVPGTERRLFAVAGVPIGIVICHEGWRYPETVRWAARRGARVVFHPHHHEPEPGAYRPTGFLDPANTFHEKAMLCRAAENTVYFASVNCAIDGAPSTSAVIRPDGTTLAWQPYGVADLLIADVDTSDATGLLAARCRTGVEPATSPARPSAPA
jgi:predicted amidohydrolase